MSMIGRTNQKNPIAPATYRHARDVVFLELRDTVFCTQCELISYNNSPKCLACGSQAVLSLARVLGGSLRGESTARVVTKTETIDAPARPMGIVPPRVTWHPQHEPAYAIAMRTESPANRAVSVMQFGVDRTRALSGADGAALAMQEGPRMVCRARAGTTAPDVGAEVPQEGLTALCARTGQMWRCSDTERDPWVNRDSCRRLGIRSVVVAPVLALRRVIGILEVFSPAPSGFSDEQTATVQLMASAIALATLRNLPLPSAENAPEG
jgi:GAF domain-containing protein